MFFYFPYGVLLKSNVKTAELVSYYEVRTA